MHGRRTRTCHSASTTSTGASGSISVASPVWTSTNVTPAGVWTPGSMPRKASEKYKVAPGARGARRWEHEPVGTMGSEEAEAEERTDSSRAWSEGKRGEEGRSHCRGRKSASPSEPGCDGARKRAWTPSVLGAGCGEEGGEGAQGTERAIQAREGDFPACRADTAWDAGALGTDADTQTQARAPTHHAGGVGHGARHCERRLDRYRRRGGEHEYLEDAGGRRAPLHSAESGGLEGGSASKWEW